MSTIKTLSIAAALLAGASTLAMAQGMGGSTNSPGATQQPGSRSGSMANEQKNKAPNNKKQDYNMQAPGAPTGK
jgi:hypothetical protein